MMESAQFPFAPIPYRESPHGVSYRGTGTSCPVAVGADYRQILSPAY